MQTAVHMTVFRERGKEGRKEGVFFFLPGSVEVYLLKLLCAQTERREVLGGLFLNVRATSRCV